jgi:hypothetical protein
MAADTRTTGFTGDDREMMYSIVKDSIVILQVLFDGTPPS